MTLSSRGLSEYVTNESYYIPTTRVPMVTKLGRLVTYLDGLFPIISHYLLITWSCEITRKKEIIISPLSQCLVSPSMIG